MPAAQPTPATVILQRLGQGDAGAEAELLALVYAELRGMADAELRGERVDHTLQATALVHEAWLRLVDGSATDWTGRAHFYGAAARAMRQVLVDHARARGAAKRGGGRARTPLDESLALYESRALDVLALDEALQRLAAADARAARIVELRFFGGLEIAEIAAALDVSVPTVERSWRMARAWLRAELDPDEAEAGA
jgi:RNA polymerase sigma factor (TIGR02999 family)